jgi:hypothetical protein
MADFFSTKCTWNPALAKSRAAWTPAIPAPTTITCPTGPRVSAAINVPSVLAEYLYYTKFRIGIVNLPTIENILKDKMP